MVILFSSSELSSAQRVSKTASKRPLSVTVSTVVIPVPEGLSLVADASIEVVTTDMDLEGVIFVKALVSVAGDTVWVFLIFASEMVLTGCKVLSKV